MTIISTETQATTRYATRVGTPTEAVLEQGKLLAETVTTDTSRDEVVSVVSRLMLLYGIFGIEECYRERAANIVIQLAQQHDAVLQLALASALEHARQLQIEDADSLSRPTPITVLAALAQHNDLAAQTLEFIAANACGLARWEVEQACKR